MDVDAERLHRPADRPDRLAAVTEFPFQRRLGAIPLRNGRTEFRVWAPKPDAVRCASAAPTTRSSTPASTSTRRTVDADAGDDYEFVLDGTPLPDPCSRWQPHGPARAVAGRRPRRLRLDRRRLPHPRPARRRDLRAARRHVLAARGRSRARSRTCAALAELGVTVIELMPVAEFPGARGWSYDGVYLSAAQSSYGGPLELQRLIDAAHADGLARAARRRLQPRRRLRHRGADGVRPLLHPQARDAVGREPQRRRRALRRGPRVGLPERRAVGRATSTSTACGWTPSTRSSTPAPSTSWPRSPAACTRSAPARW